MRLGLVSVLLGAILILAPHAIAGTVTAVPEGNASAAVVIKINGLEYKSCVYDGTTIIYTSNGPGCFVDGVDDGAVVRVESSPIRRRRSSTSRARPRRSALEGISASSRSARPGLSRHPFPRPCASGSRSRRSSRCRRRARVPAQSPAHQAASTAGRPARRRWRPGQRSSSLRPRPPGRPSPAGPGVPRSTRKVIAASSLTSTANVTATFAAALTLTVALDGAGTVTSTGQPAIACGGGQSACAVNVASGATLTLTATPADGYAFAGWNGAGCSGTEPCTVEVTQSVTVTATFLAQAVDASVTGWRTAKIGSVRTTRVTIAAGEPVDVAITIARRGVVLATRTVRGFDGTGTLRVRIPRGVRGGKATLTVTLTNEADATKRTRAGIRIPPR